MRHDSNARFVFGSVVGFDPIPSRDARVYRELKLKAGVTSRFQKKLGAAHECFTRPVWPIPSGKCHLYRLIIKGFGNDPGERIVFESTWFERPDEK